MYSLKSWIRIESGAQLELWLESASDKFVGNARVLDDDGTDVTEEEWGHADLVPGPARKTVRKGHGLVVRVRVAFTGAKSADVVIHARMVKKDGSLHGSPYDYAVSGKREDIKRATITAACSQ